MSQLLHIPILNYRNLKFTKLYHKNKALIITPWLFLLYLITICVPEFICIYCICVWQRLYVMVNYFTCLPNSAFDNVTSVAWDSPLQCLLHRNWKTLQAWLFAFSLTLVVHSTKEPGVIKYFPVSQRIGGSNHWWKE